MRAANVQLTLPPDVHETLKALAETYGSRSKAVTALVRATRQRG